MLADWLLPRTATETFDAIMENNGILAQTDQSALLSMRVKKPGFKIVVSGRQTKMLLLPIHYVILRMAVLGAG